MDLADDIYVFTENFPKNEEFGLKSQLRRCATSVPSNIAEGSSRSSNKEFNRFLEFSLGSLFEIHTQLIISERRKYISQEVSEKSESKITELQKMISGFQKTLH